MAKAKAKAIEEIKEAPVLRGGGGGDDPLPPLPEAGHEFITIRGKYGIFNIEMIGVNMIVLYTDEEGLQYSCDVDLQSV